MNSTKNEIHILLIGPVTNMSSQLVGGATISFGYLVDYLYREKACFTTINTQRPVLGVKKILTPFYIVAKTLKYISKSDVILLNTSRKGTQYLAPLLFFLAKIFGKKFVFRPFGGNMNNYTHRYGKIQTWIFRKTVLKADILFLQTKSLMEFYLPLADNPIHLPTSRNLPAKSLLRKDKPFSKRFVYLGYLYPSKGVDHILEARKQLGEDYTIHIYGPSYDGSYQQKFKEQKGIYKGVLQKNEVLQKLKEYDVLILPTYYGGEGYPGVIIEAYSLGLPVITTTWKSIPEIVEDHKTGLLIAPKSTKALLNAMQYFNTSNYPQYSHNALNYFSENFSTEKIIGRAMKQINELVIKKNLKQ